MQSPLVEMNLASAVFRHARAVPARTALVVEECAYTYGELARQAAKVARWLAVSRPGAPHPPRVGILAARSLPTYAGLLGAGWAGGAYVPLNPRQPAPRLASIIRRARLDALIVDSRGVEHLDALDLASHGVKHVLLDKVASARQVATAFTAWDEVLAPQPITAPATVVPDQPAYVMFTSGTTGVPKGVVVTCENVARFLAFMRELYLIGPEDRVGQFCETSFDVSVFEMFAAWDGGAALHVLPENQLMAPSRFIQQHELTVWTSVPSVVLMLKQLGQLKAGAFPSLRISYFIGEALPAASARAWQEAAPNSVVDNQYGPTEATVACLFQRLDGPATPQTSGRGTMAIGLPYPQMHADIVTPGGGEFLPAGEIGELALAGPQLAAGYLDDAEQTARRFPTLDHPQLGQSRWYLTGDFAFCDEQGIFHCLGRIDNQVKIMGHRVELEDVEAHLRAVAGTDTVAAVAWPVVDGAPTGIIAFVCGGELEPKALRERLRERVPPYMVPRRVVQAESLPLSTNGKVDRKALCATLEKKP
jgi:amino acid adenylation domain-containing protein